MFVIDKDANRISKIKSRTFTELGFGERANLQEWLENNPEAFGEELLIIQKEFDGFDDTRERLDLLAIDKQGDIVVIENKLDDSGRDVTWQALKYASYCSTLSKTQIKEIYQFYLDKKGSEEDSETNILEFLNVADFDEVQLNQKQRIILVAGDFRKEVTSTVLWLLTKYNMPIQCFKVTPYPYGEHIFLTAEQIIPVKEAEEFTIKMAEKAREEQNTQNQLNSRYQLCNEYWKLLLEKINSKSSLFANVSPSKGSWISAGSGVSGVGLTFVVTKNSARTEVYMSRSAVEENKFIFDQLFAQKEIIEQETGKLEWERLDNKKACRIKQELKNISLYEREDWEKMMSFMVDSMVKIEKAFKKPLQKINTQLKQKF